MIQLFSYLGKPNEAGNLKADTSQSSIIPLFSLLSLHKGWESNYTLNIFVGDNMKNTRGLESAIVSLNWYCEQLLAMNEIKLNHGDSVERYRFTMLPTFDHSIAVRLKKAGDKVTIFGKVLDGTGGYNPGKLKKDRSKSISLADWEHYERIIDSVKFWAMPSVDIKNIGCDGSRRIIEGLKNGKYHLVDRWNGSEISTLGIELLKLTELDLKKESSY